MIRTGLTRHPPATRPWWSAEVGDRLVRCAIGWPIRCRTRLPRRPTGAGASSAAAFRVLVLTVRALATPTSGKCGGFSRGRPHCPAPMAMQLGRCPFGNRVLSRCTALMTSTRRSPRGRTPSSTRRSGRIPQDGSWRSSTRHPTDAVLRVLVFALKPRLQAGRAALQPDDVVAAVRYDHCA